ncbi:MAG: hypothetical protein IT462_15670 [Planctomycetes bacterium]|nr:hypothetical protein [Planctomycetota bacterium]
MHSFHDLVGAPFSDGVNALCWQRTLHSDFGEVVRLLDTGKGVTTLEDARLSELPVSAAGRAAIVVMLEDQRLLRERGLEPVVECVREYARDDGPWPTDVYSFHVDSAPVETDTYLCTYFGSAGEGLRNDQATRRVDIPETRAALLRQFGGADNDAFAEYLREGCYDLHYAPSPQARPFSFGVGNLWRIAVQYPGSPVPPCVHRAPDTRDPRLLLIS